MVSAGAIGGALALLAEEIGLVGNQILLSVEQLPHIFPLLHQLPEELTVHRAPQVHLFIILWTNTHTHTHQQELVKNREVID